MMTEYNLPNIKTLLANGFDDQSLRRLCYDAAGFQPVYERLSPAMRSVRLINLILTHAEQNNLLDTLLRQAEAQAPDAYAKFGPYRASESPTAGPVSSQAAGQPDRASDSRPVSGSESLPAEAPSPGEIIQMQLRAESGLIGAERQRALLQILGGICDLPPSRLRLAHQKVDVGSLWVAVELPATAVRELTQADRRTQADLILDFDAQHIGLLPVQQPQEDFERLGAAQVAVLRLLNLGQQSVLIRGELGGGFGGARVLITQPVDYGGRRTAPQIAKLDTGLALRRERDNSRNYVERDLSLVAPKLVEYVEWRGQAGISYVFVNEGLLGQTRSFEAYYREEGVSLDDLDQTLRRLLDDTLGLAWYGQSKPLTAHFSAEYGRHMVEHLRLRLRPGQDDGIWIAGAQPANGQHQPLPADEVVSRHRQFGLGMAVQIDGLQVVKVKDHELKLQHPTQAGTVIKVEFPPGSQAFNLGDTVTVRGEVLYNRQARLEQIVAGIFDDEPEASVDVPGELLHWDGKLYPNPLRIYPQILDTILAARTSLVHGDLHLRNILVDQDGRAWLIDFALVMERHNLYDFIKLETYIRQTALSRREMRFSFAQYLAFEDALLADTLGQPASPPEHSHLKWAYQVIRRLRQLAATYATHPANFQKEYLPALFLYNLAVMKYVDNHGKQAARLAFIAAAVIAQALKAQPTQAKATGRCPNCGADVLAGAKFCSRCGSQIP
jgi:hypothetical protein